MLSRCLRLLTLLLLLSAGTSQAWDFLPWRKGETVAAAALPPEARETLALIRQGGPFPHRRDGITFQNREKRLPEAARGYYREYTVRTPGARDRGARRIVSGGSPPVIYYYTEDHYESFRRIQD
ncbi:ribonuclease domain-containing protein [Zoogloea sp.]|uniref:ribonuclease domain-containing protein n=1 Tax=Zoogloea sp. TaxID=49181 RepID=UPI00261A6DF2|nr:ribonuclease domain-containing protein [Zoogloea sp.]MDD3353201.1 ribonuclease domain-containing protein [Zoogloea sp.]